MSDEKKVAAAKPADEKKTAAKPAAKAAAKPAAKTAKPAAKKPAAKKAAPKAAAKTAKPAAKKPAAKKAAPAAKKPAAKKAKAVTIDSICKLVEKKIVKSKVTALKDNVAVDIEVWGFEDGSNQKMYIEVKDGKAAVMPHSYNAKDFRVSLSFKNAVDFANGKLTLAKLVADNDFYAEGNIAKAVKLASIF